MSTRFQSSCLDLSLFLPTTLSGHCYHHDRRGFPRWEKERVRDLSTCERRSLRFASSAYSVRPRFHFCPSIGMKGVPSFTGFVVQCGLLDRKIQVGGRKNKKGKAATIRTGKKRAQWVGLGLLKRTLAKICGSFLFFASNLPFFTRNHDGSIERRVLQMLLPSFPVSRSRIKLNNLVLLMLLFVFGNGEFLVSRDYCALKQLLVFANSFWRPRRSAPLRINVFSFTFSIHTFLKRLVQLVAVVSLTGFLTSRYARLI